MAEFENIEHVPISTLYKPDTNPFNYTDAEISRRAGELDPLSPPIIKVAKSDPGFAILDGLLNWMAMQLRGMQMTYIQKFECDPADYAYMSIRLNKRKQLTHRRIAMMIPIITVWWDRRNADDSSRRRKFIGETLFDLGTVYRERNIQKLMDIIKYAPILLDSMDNTDRIVDKFQKKALIQAGKLPPVEPPASGNTLHDAEESDDDDSDGCEPGKCKPTGIDVEIRIRGTINHFDSGNFCRSCIIHRLTFEAVNPIIPPDEGIDPDEDIDPDDAFITVEENPDVPPKPIAGYLLMPYVEKGGEQ